MTPSSHPQVSTTEKSGIVPARITGARLLLRLIRPEDSRYVNHLRSDPRYNAHMSPVSGLDRDQQDWIMSYLARMRAGQEYYYVIERRDGGRCGLVRLYDLDADGFTWGSWVLALNKPPKAALESAVLSLGLGFGPLDRRRVKVEVRAQNNQAIAFYRRFGMVERRTHAGTIEFDYSRDQFRADYPGHARTLGIAAA